MDEILDVPLRSGAYTSQTKELANFSRRRPSLSHDLLLSKEGQHGLALEQLPESRADAVLTDT